ncbi:MAG: D-aminoacyl-tRNA deacylase [Clostridia bacterium]|nr:D-aminoacyl-tRNA deacylase [Clostridia bacterium]
MRSVVQRVTSASVTSEGKVTGTIEKGLVVLIGVEEKDELSDVNYMVEKVSGLRIFEDEDEKMNLSVMDVGGKILAVSQFTLLGDVRKGKRPSFTKAEEPIRANELYEEVVKGLREKGLVVETGVFQTDMLVNINNDGPVTILLDSRKNF